MQHPCWTTLSSLTLRNQSEPAFISVAFFSRVSERFFGLFFVNSSSTSKLRWMDQSVHCNFAIMFEYFKVIDSALDGVAQWTEHGLPMRGWGWGCKVPGRGTRLGFRARSPVGGVQEATTHWCFSPSLSLSPPFSLKMNK